MIKNLTKPLFLILCLFAFSRAFAQAPNITYTTPQNYKLNTTITPLAPKNIGGTVPLGEYGTVSTFAGTGQYGYTDGPANIASFKIPAGMVIDNDNNVYISDYSNEVIRKITPQGLVSTFVGSGSGGRDNGTGTQASFYGPSGMVIDPSGALYVVEQNGQDVRKVTSAREVSLLAGSGFLGKANGTGPAASFNTPISIAIGPDHNLYVSDLANRLIRKVTTNGEVTTFAGNGAASSGNGSLLQASFGSPQGLAFDSKGNLYVCDDYSYTIRKISTDGTVTTFAGNGNNVSKDGTGTAAGFTYPDHLVFDTNDDLFVSDANLIRKITPQGVVTTVAGNVTAGFSDGVGEYARFYTTSGLAFDRNGFLFVGEVSNHVIRKITLTGYTINKPLPAGLFFDPTTGIISGTPTALAAAEDYTITARNKNGIGSTAVRIGVTDVGPPAPTVAPVISYQTPQKYTVNTTIAQLLPKNTGGAVPSTTAGVTSTFAGTGEEGINNGPGATATFSVVNDVATTDAGDVIVIDLGNAVLRKITPAGVVSTFVGSGVRGPKDGTGVLAELNGATGITKSPDGNLYISEEGGNTVRKLSPAGQLTTIAGNGTAGYTDAKGSLARFNNPYKIAVDKNSNIYVTDILNHAVRKITPDGTVTTFAGNGTPGFTDGAGTAARFKQPTQILADINGNILVADDGNKALRKITPDGTVSTVGIFGQPGALQALSYVSGWVTDNAGNIYVADERKNQIFKLTTNGQLSFVAGTGALASGNGKLDEASIGAPRGMSFDKQGNLYIAEAEFNKLRKISLYGYTIDKPLPAGLIFDSATGAVSGTPTIVSPATDYIVSAYNSGGGGSTTVQISVDEVPLPPPNIRYLNPQTYIVGRTIVPLEPINTGGAVQAGSYRADTPLPAGLTIDANTGIISGTPTEVSPQTQYKIFCYNGNGAGINATYPLIEVKATGFPTPAAPNISYGTPKTYQVNTTITPLLPANNGGDVFATGYGLVTTFAGTGAAGKNNGPANTATFSNPYSASFDGNGNMYVGDFTTFLIRKITPAGEVSTLAGNGTSGTADGIGQSASFVIPWDVVADKTGNVYVPEWHGNTIRKITPAGVVSTFTGTSQAGATNGNISVARFDHPGYIAIDKDNNLYVADVYNYAIRKITPAGNVSTLAGLSGSGYADGPGTVAKFADLEAIAVDKDGNVFVFDAGANRALRKITPNGTVTTIAKKGDNGPLTNFEFIGGLTIDKDGTMYLADAYGYIFKLKNGVLTLLAGNGSVGFINGAGAVASFYEPRRLSMDEAGNLYVADEGNNAIRKIAIAGYTVDKPLPAGLTFDPKTGAISGTPTVASPATNYTITANNTGGGSTTIVSIEVKTNAAPTTAPVISYETPQIYTINSAIITLFPENRGGEVQPNGYSIDKPLPAGLSFDVNTGAISGTPTILSPATIYTISAKNAISVSNATINIKVTDGLEPVAPIPDISYITPQKLPVNSTITPIIPENKGGEVKRYSYGLLANFAGTGQPGRTDGPKAGARFDGPAKVIIDAQGTFYVTDFNNYSVRKMTSDGTFSTIAGAAGPGYANGALGVSQLQGPRGIVTDKAGNVYIADVYSIRKINAAGVTSTFVGGPVPGYTDGTGTAARFDGAVSLAIDGSDNIYVIDQGNAVIRKVTPAGVVTTLAGNRNRGNTDGQGTAAAFNNPQDIIFANGALYVADYVGVRRVTTGGLVSTIAGNGVPKVLNGPALSAGFGNASALLINTAGDIYVLDIGNNAPNEGSAILRVIDKDNNVSTVDIIDGNGTKIYLASPNSLTSDKNGLIYIASGSNYIQTLSFDRYTINKTLPAGLVFDAGTGIISGKPTVISPPTNYTITAYNASGSSSTIINLEVTENPQATLLTFGSIADKTLCEADFDPGATSTKPIIYSSSNTAVATIVNNQIHVVGPGNTTITASSNGETIMQPLTVNPTLQPTITVSTSTPVPACAGVTVISFEAFTTNEGVNPVYQWQVNHINVGTNSPQFSSTSLANGDEVTCKLTKTDACPDPVSVTSAEFIVVNVVTGINPQPTVSISASVNDVFSGTPITFTAVATDANQVTSYQWLVNGENAGPNSATFTGNDFKDGDVVSCRVSYNPCTVPAISNDVRLTITAPPGIQIPNTFTPNGDGINDTWNIPDLAFYPKCVVRIFNRYGTELVQSKGYSKAWDGTFSGKLLPAGVYYYIIDTNDGQPVLSGNITILR